MCLLIEFLVDLFCSTELNVVEVAVADRDQQSALGGVLSAKEREDGENKSAESAERREEKQGSEGVRTPVKKEETEGERGADGIKGEEIFTGNEERAVGTFSKSFIIGEEMKKAERAEDKSEDGLKLVPNSKRETDATFRESDHIEKRRKEMAEEERESRLVAGIHLDEETRGDAHKDEKILSVKQEAAEKGEEENSWQILTDSQNPPPPSHHHNIPPPFPASPSTFPSTVYTKATPQFFPPAVTAPTSPVSTAVPGELTSVSFLEDVLIEVMQTPGHHGEENRLQVKASPEVEDALGQTTWLKPAQKELQTTHEARGMNRPGSESNTSTPKPKGLNITQPNPTPQSNENIPTAKPVKFTHKPNVARPTVKPKTFKSTAKQSEASLPKPQLTKPKAKPRPTTAKTPSAAPTKINRGRKNKTIRKSEGKKRKKDNKTQRPTEKKEEVATPTYFPYFKDNYCPPECACYGR